MSEKLLDDLELCRLRNLDKVVKELQVQVERQKVELREMEEEIRELRNRQVFATELETLIRGHGWTNV